MKKISFLLLAVLLFSGTNAQWKPFRFAFISDTHINDRNNIPSEDLRRTVADINQMTDIAFVVITGDITELGTDEEIRMAKEILDQLKVPYYIIPGNHDSGWSESGGVTFARVFGYDKFRFEYNGISFLGCASGPFVRMSDGHIPRDAVNWLDAELKKTDPSQPVIFLNHYPLDNGLDNWYEITDRLKKQNTLAVLCGHGHNNHVLNFEGIPGVMGRSNLRAKAETGGYNLVDVRTDSLIFSERRPGVNTLLPWAKVKLQKHDYASMPRPATHPVYTLNDSFPAVKPKWTFSSDANVISTPAVAGKLVVFGNSIGRIDALNISNGKKQWSYQTRGAIYSSPAVSENKVVLGSGDGNVYCLDAVKGKLLWSFKAGAAVLGSPLISNNTVYIGASDHAFRAIDLQTGREKWRFDSLGGPMVSTPVIHDGHVIFGAWDTYLYSLDAVTGKLNWKWSNGSTVKNLSPASCIPLIHDGVIYVAAPDRVLSAIDFKTGSTLWRSKEGALRESTGISADGKWIYGKSMNDSIVAFPTSRTLPQAAWKLNCGFGYEHAPSMLTEKDGQLIFGTKNGRVYSVNTRTREKSWAYKIDNSMVNTVNVISSRSVIASTMDGKVCLLEVN
ncbi:outer membrane protein assembly factor BamB family protein [Sediminibacterium ginsengisoli]|nr:PQQ-binding-like beta-propeller repeat protein [Sediminibacterium ginsengisoli]